MNYLGGVWCLRAFLPGLRRAASGGGAHVVNLVSVAGTVAFAPAGAYAPSKHAQLAFSRSTRPCFAEAGSACTRSCRLRRDGGLSPAHGALAARCCALRDRAEEVAPTIVDAVEKGKREVTVLVPVPVDRDRAGARARECSRSSQVGLV